MTALAKLGILAGAAAANPLYFPGWLSDQLPLRSGPAKDASSVSSAAGFTCSLPPALDPSADGLPSADDLFSTPAALAKQVERHQAVVRVPSVSYDDLGEPGEDDRWAPFFDLHGVLEHLYPKLYTRATVEKVNTLGLVYTVEGTDPSLKPTLLAAHQDVVPVADASTWTYPPFEAVYDGEWLWGRGASDDKNSLTSLLSAVDTLLANPDWSPRRTIVVAFGFDEECSGFRGAGTIGPHLLERYGEDGIAVILDEGGLGTQSPDPSTLYALPAVMEKGHVDIWFDLSVAGGHSSVPFPHTGIGIVAEMIAALESNPYSPSIPDGGPVHNGLQCQARYSPSADPNVTRLVNSHDLDALAALLAAQDRPSQFSIQTSQSVDMIAGGQKINAMPESIMLGVNYRVAPQDSIPLVQHNVVKHIGAVVEKYGIQLRAFEGDDEYEAYVASSSSSLPTRDDVVRPEYDVDYNGVLVLEAKEKSAVTPASPTSGPVWDTFSGTIQHTFASEGTTVVPVGGIMTGNTDTRHYLKLTPNVYRWSPNLHGGSEGVHTVDERVRMDAHMGMVKFYYNFVRAFDQADL